MDWRLLLPLSVRYHPNKSGYKKNPPRKTGRVSCAPIVKDWGSAHEFYSWLSGNAGEWSSGLQVGPATGNAAAAAATGGKRAAVGQDAKQAVFATGLAVLMA